jgi:hypothetical protein
MSGWQLLKMTDDYSNWPVLAGEYDGPNQWIVLDVAGDLIVDSREKK